MIAPAQMPHDGRGHEIEVLARLGGRLALIRATHIAVVELPPEADGAEAGSRWTGLLDTELSERRP